MLTKKLDELINRNKESCKKDKNENNRTVNTSSKLGKASGITESELVEVSNATIESEGKKVITNKGIMIIDATVAEQKIKYPNGFRINA